MGCVPYAIQVYIERNGIDTGQSIVEMVASGMSHWYYRSDQFIASKFGEKGTDYTGLIGEIPEEIKSFYGTFREAPRSMGLAQLAVEMRCNSFEEFSGKLKDRRLGS